MTDRPAMTMREIREGLGHVKPGQPEVIVSVTRYTVSVLPAGDINHKYFALHVELKRDGWIVTDGHGFYGPAGARELSQSTAHHFADYDDALALARKLAPVLTVNGRSATEVWQRTQESGQSESIGWCTFGEDEAHGAGCIKTAGHSGAHLVTRGDADFDD